MKDQKFGFAVGNVEKTVGLKSTQCFTLKTFLAKRKKWRDYQGSVSSLKKIVSKTEIVCLNLNHLYDAGNTF